MTPPPSFSKLNFISKILNFTMQINAYQEGTEINTEMNERPLKNIGTHMNDFNEYQFPSAQPSLPMEATGRPSGVWQQVVKQFWANLSALRGRDP